jgi:ParB-like chromosome segregation protein Spo0J
MSVTERDVADPRTLFAKPEKSWSEDARLMFDAASMVSDDSEICSFLRAAHKAGWKTIPAIVEEGELNKGDVVLLQIIENVQREDLTPIEKAKAMGALMEEAGWNASQVASKLGLSGGIVSKLLSALSLPEQIQRRIHDGELPLTTAYELTKLDDPEAQNRLASLAAAGKLTREHVRAAIRAKKRIQLRVRKPRPMRVTAKLGSREALSVRADSLNLDSFVSILEKVLAHAQKARADGLTLETLIERLNASRSAVEAQSHAV